MSIIRSLKGADKEHSLFIEKTPVINLETDDGMISQIRLGLPIWLDRSGSTVMLWTFTACIYEITPQNHQFVPVYYLTSYVWYFTFTFDLFLQFLQDYSYMISCHKFVKGWEAWNSKTKQQMIASICTGKGHLITWLGCCSDKRSGTSTCCSNKQISQLISCIYLCCSREVRWKNDFLFLSAPRQ